MDDCFKMARTHRGQSAHQHQRRVTGQRPRPMTGQELGIPGTGEGERAETLGHKKLRSPGIGSKAIQRGLGEEDECLEILTGPGSGPRSKGHGGRRHQVGPRDSVCPGTL